MSLSLRTALRSAVTGVTVGAVGLTAAWAAAGLAPAGPGSPTGDVSASHGPGTDPPAFPVLSGAPDWLPGTDGDGTATVAPVAAAAAAVDALTSGRLDGGWFRAGTGRASLLPDPDIWVEGSDCTGAPEQLYTPLTPEGCLITFDMRWADGFDEENPIEVHAVALSNGEDVVVVSMLDLVGYMASYPDGTCDRCGLTEIAEDLEAELGVPMAHFTFSMTHTHAAPSTIADGPAWYYDQVRDRVKEAVRAAIADAATQPAVRVESGSARAKELNLDRRITDRAVPDDELVWLRAFVPAADGAGPGTTVATLGNFGVHATVRGGNAELHSGAIGPFQRRIAERLGGGSVWLPGGLGDMEGNRNLGVNGLGISMADVLIDAVLDGRGDVLESNDIAVARSTVAIPVENQFFTGALAVGYAVRNILPPYGGGPLTASPRVGGANAPSCVSAAPVHVVGPVSAIRLGEAPSRELVEFGAEDRRPPATDNVVLLQSPGEMFASMSLVLRDYLNVSDNVLVQSITNDTLGYMVPSNQFDATAGQGLGVANNITRVGNYEEALSLGPCTGDIVMNGLLEVATELGVMGIGENR
jgi:hypothetical protein